MTTRELQQSHRAVNKATQSFALFPCKASTSFLKVSPLKPAFLTLKLTPGGKANTLSEAGLALGQSSVWGVFFLNMRNTVVLMLF